MVQLGQQFPPKTTRLVMDRNKVARVPAGAFQGLNQLYYLSMADNNISVVEVRQCVVTGGRGKEWMVLFGLLLFNVLMTSKVRSGCV